MIAFKIVLSKSRLTSIDLRYDYQKQFEYGIFIERNSLTTFNIKVLTSAYCVWFFFTSSNCRRDNFAQMILMTIKVVFQILRSDDH